MEFDFRSPVKRKQAFYTMASKEKNRDVVAKAKFDEPPYYMWFLESWTTRREESEDETEHLSDRTDTESQGFI